MSGFFRITGYNQDNRIGAGFQDNLYICHSGRRAGIFLILELRTERLELRIQAGLQNNLYICHPALDAGSSLS